MATRGPEETQKLINDEISNLYSGIKAIREEGVSEATKEKELSIEQLFLKKIEHIITECSINERSQLSLNQSLPNPLTGKNVMPMDFFDEVGLKTICAGLEFLAKKYHCQAIEYIPDIETYTENEFVGLEEITSMAPRQFTQKQDDSLVEDSKRERYVIKRKLEGRGQAGLANFYGKEEENNPKAQLLIKQDTPETCILEGTAYFAKAAELLPRPLQNAANFATIGTILTPRGDSLIVTVQPRVATSTQTGTVRPWDEIIYGRKRNPKTLFSEESWWPDYITSGIAELNSDAQWQLAAGIVYSQMVGDESLHIAQFMADVDEHNIVQGIKRIDFGARERFAIAREANDQSSPYHTSDQYQKSGQWGKDYSGFLLANPSLKHKVSFLWIRFGRVGIPELKEKVKKHSKEAMIAAFSALPPKSKAQALEGVLKTINNKAEQPFTIDPSVSDIDAKINLVAEQIAALDANRIVAMTDKALDTFEYIDFAQFSSEYKKMWNEYNELFLEIRENVDKLKAYDQVDIEKLEALSRKLDQEIATLIEACKKTDSGTAHEKIKLLSKVGAELYEIARLNEMSTPQNLSMTALEEKAKKYQTINDIASYSLATKSINKKMQCATMMEITMNGKLATYLKKNPAIVQSLCEHASYTGYAMSFGGKKAEGHWLLLKLFKKYGIDTRYLTLTNNQRDILDSAQQSNTTDALLKMVNEKSFIVDDALVQDEHGRTTLHYLMKNANIKNQHAIPAIIKILSSAIGKTKNANLDIEDIDGKTPLHYLLENSDARELITAINEAAIKGYWGGHYKVQDFFVNEEIYKNNERKMVQEIGEGKTAQKIEGPG